MNQPAFAFFCLFLAGLLFSFKMQKTNQSFEKVQNCSFCGCNNVDRYVCASLPVRWALGTWGKLCSFLERLTSVPTSFPRCP